MLEENARKILKNVFKNFIYSYLYPLFINIINV